MLRRCIFLVTVLVVLLLSAISVSAQPGEYLGELCFRVTNNEEWTGKLKIGVFMYGDKHLLWSGVQEYITPAGNPEPVHGSGEFINGKIVLVANWAPAIYPPGGSWRGTETDKIVIDPVSLNGTAYFTFYKINTVNGDVSVAEGSYPVKFIACD